MFAPESPTPAPAPTAWIAFEGHTRIPHGAPHEVVAALHALAGRTPTLQPLVFDARSSERIELNLRAPLATLLESLPAQPAEPADPPPEPHRGPGRPKLGVTAREVTLLPRHWDWLASQPGGASVALRKLVQLAMRESRERDQAREATEAAYRFMSVLASSLPGFEEASRALFAGELVRLEHLVAPWPADVRDHLLTLARRALAPLPDAAEQTA